MFVLSIYFPIRSNIPPLISWFNSDIKGHLFQMLVQIIMMCIRNHPLAIIFCIFKNLKWYFWLFFLWIDWWVRISCQPLVYLILKLMFLIFDFRIPFLDENFNWLNVIFVKFWGCLLLRRKNLLLFHLYRLNLFFFLFLFGLFFNRQQFQTWPIYQTVISICVFIFCWMYFW